MAIMKLCLVFALCMLATRQCIPCEASRKMLMEVEAEGNGPFLSVSRKILSEEGEEVNDMETELLLPDMSEGEKVDIEQQEPFKNLEKEHHEEDLLMLPESGDGDLALEGSQGKKAGENKQIKKKENNEVGGRDESTWKSTEKNLQEDRKKEKKKARNDMQEHSSTGQAFEEDPFLGTGKGADEAEGILQEDSRSEVAEGGTETRRAALPSDVGEEEIGASASKEKVQTEEHSSDASEQQESINNTQQSKAEDTKKKSLKPKKNKKEEVERAVKAKASIAHSDEVLKSKVQDDEAVKGEAEAKEIADEVMPAELIEQEMQGGVVEEEKVVEEEQQAKEEAGTSGMKEDESKLVKGGGKAKKKSKKPKTSKQSKPELQVSEEENAESKNPSELQGDSKQVEKIQDKAESKAKKKKVKSFGKLKKEENSFEESEEIEMPSDDNKTNKGVKHSKVTEAKGEEEKLPKVEMLGELDVDTSAEEDTSMKTQSQVEKPSNGTEDELPTIEKQEEKLDVEVQDIAKEAQERAEGYEGSISAAKSVLSSAQGGDEDDDEYGDFLQDFTDLSTKFQDTALKVADHLGPNIQKFTDTSKVYFNKANQQITESFSPLVGKQFAPLLASLLSYGLLLAPLAVVIVLFEHIRALLSLQKILLFVNIYLAAYFATLLFATFIMGEPMNYFYKSSASGYVHLQILQALAYITYLVLQTFDLIFTCTSETVPVKVTVALQWLVAFTVGFHYYVTVFHRAMSLKGPHTNWKIYGIYSVAFLVLCLFARIKRVKKGYSQDGQADTDKKH